MNSSREQVLSIPYDGNAFLISHCKMGLDVHKKLSYYSIGRQQGNRSEERRWIKDIYHTLFS